MSSPQSAPILIVGVANIAKALGVSPRKVRYEYLMHPDFPARKEKAAGSWISTRQSLAVWAQAYVTQGRG
jgi:hypothetical protein